MKPLEQRSEYVDYMTGKQVKGERFAFGAWDIFSTYVWSDLIRGHCGRQASFDIEGFDGDVFYTKSRPVEIKTPEQKRLSEGRELKNGISKKI